MAKKQTRNSSTKVARAKIGHHVKMAVVPHAANEHRPHLVRRYGIALVLIAVIAGQIVYNTVVSGNVLGIQAALTSKTLLDATNQTRAERGVAPLKYNDDLGRAAQLKLDDMFAHQYWAHMAPDGTTPWYWFEQVEYRYAEAGENLAKNFSTSKGVVSAWMVSPTHRANVLKTTYRDVGFAVKSGLLDGKEMTLIVAMYGTPETQLVQGAADTDAPVVGVRLSPMAQLGIGLRQLNPVATASIVVLLAMANVALVAHMYRKRLPLALRKGWYRHHGMYKAVFLAAIATLLIAAYGSSGQI